MKISIVGSTGSIGKQTLEVIKTHPHEFTVTGISAFSDWQTLLEQIISFKPLKAAITDEKAFSCLRQNLPRDCKTEIISGADASEYIACFDETELSVIATVGISGLKPVLSAIKKNKQVALATKEALVVGGSIVMKAANEKGIELRPIDSEHSAVYQCLKNERKYLSKIILTSSGGPFRGCRDLANISISQVLSHPTWKMGRKITVDSATLMNKGFEVIEAAFLFGVCHSMIDVIVHPQSIIHSMVEFCDGSTLAQLSAPDMRLAIQYALSMPGRLSNNWNRMDLTQIGSLTFEKPDTKTFPCLEFAYEALKTGKTMPAALNGANEEVVAAFLDGKIAFGEIPKIIESVISSHQPLDETKMENLMEADSQSRKNAREIISKLTR